MKKLALIILLATWVMPIPAAAQPKQPAGAGKAAASQAPADLLRGVIAGYRATGEVEQYSQDNVTPLIADRAAAFQGYPIVAAASRRYGAVRVDVFQATHPTTAYGLFSANLAQAEPKTEPYAVGSDGASIPAAVVFWKGNYFAYVSGADAPPGSFKSDTVKRMASGIADAIQVEAQSNARPPLLKSLPAEFRVAGSERYLLSAESLRPYTGYGEEILSFAGDAEAAVAVYQDGDRSPAVRLVIVEYHTPQFATDGWKRLNAYVNSLPEEQRSRTLIEREGNFIVQAFGITDADFARRLVDKVEYPYTVKWLRDPLLPTTDPFHMQKAAQLLLSTVTIVGLMLAGVLVVGTAVGTTVFLKRRKRQQEIFSDAGGMLHLDIDSFEPAGRSLKP